MCGACYRRAWLDGTLIDHPTAVRPADLLLEDYVQLRREGYTVRQIADRLGMTFAAVDRALHRARRRGDTRAAA
jgi:hypothetical protein